MKGGVRVLWNFTWGEYIRKTAGVHWEGVTRDRKIEGAVLGKGRPLSSGGITMADNDDNDDGASISTMHIQHSLSQC